MTTTLCDTREVYGEDYSDLSVIYQYDDSEITCHHMLLVHARKMDSIGRPRIYETCINCGFCSSQQLKTSDHPNWIAYPIVDQNYGPMDARLSRSFISARNIDPVINVTSDSGGYQIEQDRVWHYWDLYFGGKCLDVWNDVLENMSWRDIPRQRARALQFGLTNVFYHDKIIDVLVAVDFDPSEYAGVLSSAIGKRIPTDSILFSTDCSGWDLFGENFFYSDFLASLQWQQTRSRAILWHPNSRSALECRPACEMPNCSGQSRKIDCHHLTYARAGHEKPGDLIFLCSECHENIEYMNKLIPIEYNLARTNTTTDAT